VPTLTGTSLALGHLTDTSSAPSQGTYHICLLWLSHQRGWHLDAANQGISNGQFIEETIEPSYLPGINSLFIVCVGIIRNNYLVGGRARAEARTSATERVLYCTWWPNALTTQPHGQVMSCITTPTKYAVLNWPYCCVSRYQESENWHIGSTSTCLSSPVMDQ